MKQEAKTSITDVRTVAVPVTNADRALDFYVNKLGFEKRMDVPFGEGGRWIEVAPVGAATTLALAPAGGTASAGSDTGIRLTTMDADADHQRLLAGGVDADPEVMRIGGGVPPMFSFRDPDGNRLYAVEQSSR
jgi:catechol 2,3-dioxygenase-like lactoylglutathione lyase family enzyme